MNDFHFFKCLTFLFLSQKQKKLEEYILPKGTYNTNFTPAFQKVRSISQ